jgi:hypothetical protein
MWIYACLNAIIFLFFKRNAILFFEMQNSKGSPYCAIINIYNKGRAHHCTRKKKKKRRKTRNKRNAIMLATDIIYHLKNKRFRMYALGATTLGCHHLIRSTSNPASRLQRPDDTLGANLRKKTTCLSDNRKQHAYLITESKLCNKKY